MKMREIKFLYNYKKLYGQTTALLLHVENIRVSPELIQYDTKYIDRSSLTGYSYKKFNENLEYIQLVFLGNKGIPFGAVIPAYIMNKKKRIDKQYYYKNLVNQWFKIVIVNQ